MNLDKILDQLHEIESSTDIDWLKKKLVFFNKVISKASGDNPFSNYFSKKAEIFKEATEERIQQLTKEEAE